MTNDNLRRTDEPAADPAEDLSIRAMGRSLAQGFGILLFLTAILGVVYPAVVTGAAGVLAPREAAGSAVEFEGSPAGSELLGQDWGGTGLFEGRPSAAGWNPKLSGASNAALSNPEYLAAVKARIERWKAKTGSDAPVPADLVTASGSGLDPDISVEAARYQAGAVAAATGLPLERVKQLIDGAAREPFLAFAPSPIVNVLSLNMAVAKAAGWTAEDIAARRDAAKRAQAQGAETAP